MAFHSQYGSGEYFVGSQQEADKAALRDAARRASPEAQAASENAYNQISDKMAEQSFGKPYEQLTDAQKDAIENAVYDVAPSLQTENYHQWNNGTPSDFTHAMQNPPKVEVSQQAAPQSQDWTMDVTVTRKDTQQPSMQAEANTHAVDQTTEQRVAQVKADYVTKDFNHSFGKTYDEFKQEFGRDEADKALKVIADRADRMVPSFNDSAQWANGNTPSDYAHAIKQMNEHKPQVLGNATMQPAHHEAAQTQAPQHQSTGWTINVGETKQVRTAAQDAAYQGKKLHVQDEEKYAGPQQQEAPAQSSPGKLNLPQGMGRVTATHQVAVGEQPQMTTRQAQEILKAQGANLGDFGSNHDGLDGIKGKVTTARIQEFQKAHGLPETGNLDPNTVVALRQEQQKMPAMVQMQQQQQQQQQEQQQIVVHEQNGPVHAMGTEQHAHTRTGRILEAIQQQAHHGPHEHRHFGHRHEHNSVAGMTHDALSAVKDLGREMRHIGRATHIEGAGEIGRAVGGMAQTAKSLGNLLG